MPATNLTATAAKILADAANKGSTRPFNSNGKRWQAAVAELLAAGLVRVTITSAYDGAPARVVAA